VKAFEKYSAGLKTLAVLAVFIVTVWATATIVDRRGQSFTEREEAMLRDLEPALPSLVLSVDDLSGLPGNYYDCTSSGRLLQDYISFDSDGGLGGNLKEVEVIEGKHLTRADAGFCDDESGAWIWSTVSLPDTKRDLLFWLRTDTEFSHGTDEDLARVLTATSERIDPDMEPRDATWIDIGDFGHAAYGLEFTASESGYEHDFAVYDVSFVRGVVGASLSVKVPADVTRPEAIALASEFAERIKAKVESLPRKRGGALAVTRT
jgi:hypothetical protein